MSLEFSGLHGMSLPTTLAQAHTGAEMWRRQRATIGGGSRASARAREDGGSLGPMDHLGATTTLVRTSRAQTRRDTTALWRDAEATVRGECAKTVMIRTERWMGVSCRSLCSLAPTRACSLGRMRVPRQHLDATWLADMRGLVEPNPWRGAQRSGRVVTRHSVSAHGGEQSGVHAILPKHTSVAERRGHACK
jgi:hypothetical protein